MATKKDPNQDQADMAPTASSEQPAPAKILRSPTAADLAAAQEVAERAAGLARLAPGSVLELPHGWTPYVLDLGIDEGRLEAQRANLKRKGYTKADGLSVVGINRPEVWVIPTQVHKDVHMAARQERDDLSRKRLKITQMPG